MELRLVLQSLESLFEDYAMKLFHLQWKRFIRSPFLVAIAGCTVGYLCLWTREFSYLEQTVSTSFHIAQDLINGLSMFLGLCAFLFLGLFMLLSYEQFRGASAYGTEETINASTAGRKKHFISQTVFLVLFAVGLWLLISILCFYQLWDHRELNIPKELYKNLFAATILYSFLPSLAGIAFGAAWQGKKGKLGFYFFFTTVVFFSGRLAEELYQTLGTLLGNALSPQIGIGIQKCMDFLYRIQPVYNNVANSTYGIGIEPYRWAILLFWILGAWGVYLLKAGRLSFKASGVLLVTFALTCGSFAWYCDHDPQEYIQTPYKRLARSDPTYYANLKQKGQTAEFTVETCQIELFVFDRLSAEVRLTLEPIVLSEYTFTLHHDYEVKNITDGVGGELKFSCDQDYITVYNPTGAPLRELCFSYSGCHSSFYSNRQGLYLPGGFAFYPMEGKRIIDSNGMLSAEGKALSVRYYDVEIHFSLPAFSNLSQGADKHFCGAADSLSIVGGMYRCEEQDGVRLIMPWAFETERVLQDLSEELNKVESQIGLTFSQPQWTTVIYSPTVILPTGSTGECVSMGDTLLVGMTYTGADIGQILYAACAESVSAAPASAVKDLYLQILRDMLHGDPTGMQSLQTLFDDTNPETFSPSEYLSAEEQESMTIGYYLYHIMKKSSLPELMKTIEAWLLQECHQDDLAFVKSLWEGVNNHAGN